MANKSKLNSTTDVPNKEVTKQLSNDMKDYSSFKIVLFYCSLIVFLPVLIFFCMKSVFLDRLFTMTEVTSNIYSAVAAVLALHLALALYIYQAYFGTATTEKTKRN
ncbi:vacuolar ATPase assembly integral membrane protein VMA21 homolog [Glossina fuscipes]|uniref:Vacuolar ATPase assembly integral membrane protein VMA21 homolog n=1 Tax=Glossina fuscipes TaxID=7396 RepID=A0A9C5ZCY5_9MUSC|nr:vacuolar ATPase assembly integral membrane protein VMA21 homolog [Glossina fuscipes]